MKRLSTLILVLGLILLTVAPAAWAFEDTTVADTWFDSATQYPTQNRLNITSSGNPADGSCTPFSTGLLKFDISPILTEPVGDKTIDTVIFKLTVSGTSAAWPGPVILTLYSVTNDTWVEADVTAARGAIADPLATVSLTTKPANGTVLIFPSTPAFVAFLRSKSSATGGPGNDLVSLAVRMTSCGGGNTTVNLASRRHTTTLWRPFMQLLNPNAVTLTTFRSSDPALNWPLVAGVIALMGLVVAGGVLLRRRVA